MFSLQRYFHHEGALQSSLSVKNRVQKLWRKRVLTNVKLQRCKFVIDIEACTDKVLNCITWLKRLPHAYYWRNSLEKQKVCLDKTQVDTPLLH